MGKWFKRDHPKKIDLDDVLSSVFNDHLHCIQKQAVHTTQEVFGELALSNATLRRDRYAEEAIKLMQSCHMSQDQVIQMVKNVYAKPIEPDISNKVFGTFFTLMTLTSSHNIDLTQCWHHHYQRLCTRINEIRHKESLTYLRE